jgi:hypothetical protein
MTPDHGTAKDRYDWADDPTAQDVIDALRLLITAQQDPAKVDRLLRCLLEFAPDTDSSRGIDLLLRLLAEGTLRAEVC